MNAASTQLEIPEKLEKYIATRDNKFLRDGTAIFPNELRNQFRQLLERGSIKVGGRSACGSSCDRTWKTFAAWNEIIMKAQQLGYEIEVVSIKQKNAYATIAGGFWHENDYILTKQLELA